MALKGVALRDIMHFGRWASESSYREYVKKGEVLLVRAANEEQVKQRHRVIALSRLAGVVLRVGLPGGHMVKVESSSMDVSAHA